MRDFKLLFIILIVMFLLSQIVTECDLLHVIFFLLVFLNASQKYLKITTLRRSLAFHMGVLETLEKVNFS